MSAARFAMFGGGGAKCKNCNETVYASEKTEYDGQVYHSSCFKCLECKKVVSLTAVAMIKGDLYCKNCFMRIFRREGRYSSFGDKTLPKAEGGAGSTEPAAAAAAPAAAAPSSTPAASPAAAAAPTPQASSERRQSAVVLPCVVAECKAPRVARKSYCLEHLQSVGSADASEASQELFDAIAQRRVERVREILGKESTAQIVFRPNAKGVTPLEAAFTGIQNSRACGEAILSWLQTKVTALEQSAGGAAAQQ